MPGRRIINTSPLVFLTRVGLLELLRMEDHEVVVPEPVLAEIQGHGEDDPTVKAIRDLDWLTVLASPPIPGAIAAWDLGAGESAVLALALAETGSRIVVDDREARRCARSLSIPFIGTLGLVLLAKEKGLIPAARPVIERLRASGMYLSDEVMNEALARTGE